VVRLGLSAQGGGGEQTEHGIKDGLDHKNKPLQ
jgi:hypothetical protein